MAQASKAQLIELANKLRREAVAWRCENPTGYPRMVAETRAQLRSAGLAQAEVDDLLPAGLDAAPPPCRLNPLADHVVIRPATPKAMTESGLVIPDSAQEVPMRGTVLAVGPGRREPGIGTVLPAVQVGDDVLFGRYAGVEVTLDGEQLRIMREEDLLGTLAPEAA